MATLVTGRMVQNGTVSTEDLEQGVAIPPGAVMSFAVSAAPVGWLACDGTAVSRNQYSSLFAAVGTIYGVGNNSTTFNVPNLQGQFVRGLTTNQSTASRDPLSVSRVLGNVQEDEYKSHTHNVNNQTAEGPAWLALSRNDINPTAANDGTAFAPGGSGNDRIFYIVNSGGAETRPVNIALLYCIKY